MSEVKVEGDDTYYTKKIDDLYEELKVFIRSDTIKNYDNDLMYIHITLNNICNQFKLFTKEDVIVYHNDLTLAVLESYQLLKKNYARNKA